MNEQQLNNLFVMLAKQLGTTVEQLWAVMVLQARIEIIIVVFWVLTAVGMIYVSLKYAFPYIGNNVNNSDLPASKCLMCITWGIFILMAGITFGKAFDKMITLPTLMLNPEYWALTQIIKTIGELK